MKRIPSIDIARGLAMVIMALDHTRDFLHLYSQTHSPTDIATTTPLFFFTRWVTHFCAPCFVFLSGVSAAVAIAGSKDPKASRGFLLRRGIILLVLEFTLVNFAFSFDPQFRLFLFEVIATIGTGFIFLSFLSRLPVKFLLALSLLLVFGHDLLTPSVMSAPNPTAGGLANTLRFIRTLVWSLDSFPLSPRRLFVVAYPILPWLGIMLAGFACGHLFARPAAARKKYFFGWASPPWGFFCCSALSIYTAIPFRGPCSETMFIRSCPFSMSANILLLCCLAWLRLVCSSSSWLRRNTAKIWLHGYC